MHDLLADARLIDLREQCVSTSVFTPARLAVQRVVTMISAGGAVRGLRLPYR